ncbi:COX15/CtaA family protein [Mucilaginibacter lacusdianchii]|uniref:COX15/CtaA family protein n=1 Tax=Mucilaginibacter lacusdianchii TaxID=2684211 RepID=UPI00131CB702|nr:COX15/CtaA family protein [Mucilaginibacter sp. JXJ CY 39]
MFASLPQPFTYKHNQRLITYWLCLGLFMLFVQILLGGITRLTGSGLSITEWKPLLGALPPLTQQAWQDSFEKYQHIAQFKKLNSHFTLADYKAIFFWEWLHREWARLMGLVFLIPFIWFIIRKQISKNMIRPLLILFLLGGLQGAIGWIMVQSGLNDTDVRVSHIRLAVHFMCALFLLGYLLWFTLKMSIPQKAVAYIPQLKHLTLAILILLALQLTYGAFMAGLHAALFAPTWPDINGVYIPQEMMSNSILYNVIYQPLAVQFIHRSLAYIIGMLTIIWFISAYKAPQYTLINRLKWLPLLLIITQIILGIVTLINSPFHHAISLAVAHQFVGILTLLVFLTCYYLSSRNKAY